MGKEELLAVVTINKEAVGGDIPIFFASTEDEQVHVAGVLSNILKAMVHDVGNGVFIIAKH